MNKQDAEKEVMRLWRELHEHCTEKIAKIESLCDDHGIVNYFTGLPPFDEYGNSGWYLPMKEGSNPWMTSDQMVEDYGYRAEAGSWVSSSDRCD